MKFSKLAWFLGVFSACLALPARSQTSIQLYKFTDLGTLGGANSAAYGINASGQVVGYSDTSVPNIFHAFRTAANSPINPLTDDLGALGGMVSVATSINDFGQVAGYAPPIAYGPPSFLIHAFRTSANSPIHPATDDLSADVTRSWALGINASGQVVGYANTTADAPDLAFRTAPNSAINPLTDIFGTLGGTNGVAYGINASGQVVGYASTTGNLAVHAFRQTGSQMSDVGTLGGMLSQANGINDSGQVVGLADATGNAGPYAFRTAPNRVINPLTDDLGTLGGNGSVALSINAYGEVVGYASTIGDTAIHAFLYNDGAMFDLNDLIPAGSGVVLNSATGINSAGQIVGYTCCNPQYPLQRRAFLLTPIYRALVTPPIRADGSSVFNTSRTIPVKFTLTENDVATCILPPATISITRTASGTVVFSSPIEPTGCQYHYNLAASSLGVGTYLVDINVNGIAVGHAMFALK